MTRFIASRICRAPDGAPSAGGVQRILPHSDQAEIALLGSILINNRTFDRVNEFLKPEHFANRVHGMLFEAIGALQERGQVADPITLFQFRGQNPDLVATGGVEYLLKLANSFVSTINAVDYGRIIYDLYLRRKLIEIGDDVITSAFADGAESDGQQQIEQAEKRLFDLAVRQGEGGFVALKRALDNAVKTAEAAYKRDGKLSGMTTGLRDLDELLAGMQPSDLLILAGRPSMGKTALAMNIAVAAARTFEEDQPNRRHSVAVFSLEMSAEQLASRLLADESRIVSDKIRKGQLNNDEFEQLVRASRELEQLSLFIDDTPALQISALRSRARRLKRQSGLSLIVVDYLQLLRGSQDSRNENRVQEVSDITRGLKAVAKELHVPVLALSQLSRQVEAREDKRPMLSDLRESGSIEQDADVVMFIYREEYYLARREPDKGTEEYHTWQMAMSKVHNLAEIIVAKQRHGPIGRVEAHFDSATTRFSNHIAADRLPDAY